jgi:hypothetical protein
MKGRGRVARPIETTGPSTGLAAAARIAGRSRHAPPPVDATTPFEAPAIAQSAACRSHDAGPEGAVCRAGASAWQEGETGAAVEETRAAAASHATRQ